jgi:hypothetical protein
MGGQVAVVVTNGITCPVNIPFDIRHFSDKVRVLAFLFFRAFIRTAGFKALVLFV